MQTTEPASRDDLVLLRALIARAGTLQTASAKEDLLAEVESLASHNWQEEELRVVYRSLRAALRHTAIPLRQQMAIEATRMGHPDVDWPVYW